jgi:hypothetical protein
MPVASAVSGEVVIVQSDILSDEQQEFIEKVVWGFATGVRYQILERRPMLERVLSDGHFLLLQKSGRLTGTLFCLNKSISLGSGMSANAVYESVLSVHPEEGGKGYAKRLLQEAGSSIQGRCIEYAYIETKNIPSAAAFKTQGFQILGQFHAMTFNRLRPQLSSRVSRLLSKDAKTIQDKLLELYKGHAFLDFETSFDSSHYWVLMDKGQIVSGVQVEEERWSIESMPGIEGWFAVSILPHLPLLNRVLNPKNIPVLKIGNLFIPEGREQEFMELIAHLTFHYRKKLALAYLDKRSLVTQRLQKTISFGPFNALFETPVNIWARFYGFQESEIVRLRGRPVVISPSDIS